jgi:cytochrome d ubiquinol oxidase subunit I
MYFLRLGIPFLIVTAALGAYFFLSLSAASPYIYAAATGDMTTAQYNLLPLLVAYPGLLLIAGGSAVALYLLARRGSISRLTALVLLIAASLTVPVVEAVNDASRAPYMVITNDAGLPVNVFANSMIPVSWSIAELAVTIAIVVMATFFVGIYFIYKVRTGPITQDAL